MKPQTRFALLTLIGLPVLAVAGCNTVEGVGYDIASGANLVRGWFR